MTHSGRHPREPPKIVFPVADQRPPPSSPTHQARLRPHPSSRHGRAVCRDYCVADVVDRPFPGSPNLNPERSSSGLSKQRGGPPELTDDDVIASGRRRRPCRRHSDRLNRKRTSPFARASECRRVPRRTPAPDHRQSSRSTPTLDSLSAPEQASPARAPDRGGSSARRRTLGTSVRRASDFLAHFWRILRAKTAR
jgi:hypothetical protein